MANFIRSINDATILDFGAFAGLVLIVVDSSWLAFFIYTIIFIGFHLEKRFGLIGRKLSSKTKNFNDKKDEAKVEQTKVSDNLEKVEDFSMGEEMKKSQEEGVLHETTKSVAVVNDDVEDDDCSRKMSGDCVAKAKEEEIKHEEASHQEHGVEIKVEEGILSKVENLFSRSSSESSVSSAESEDHKEDFVKVSAELRSDEVGHLPDESLEKNSGKFTETVEESTKRLQKLYEDEDEPASNRLIDISDDLPTPPTDDQIFTVGSEKEEHATAKFLSSSSEGHSQESSLERSINLEGPKVNDDDEDRSLPSSLGMEQAVVETKEIRVSTEHSEEPEIKLVACGEVPIEAVTEVYWQETEHVVEEVSQSNSSISVTNQSKFVTNGDESNVQFKPEKDGHSSKAPDQKEISSEEEKHYEESY